MPAMEYSEELKELEQRNKVKPKCPRCKKHNTEILWDDGEYVMVKCYDCGYLGMTCNYVDWTEME